MFQHAINSLVIIYYFLFKINTVESGCYITSKEENLAWDLFSIKCVSGALYSRRSYQLPPFFVHTAGSSLPPFLQVTSFEYEKATFNAKFILPEKPLRPSS